MGNSDPDISSGNCYYFDGFRSDKAFIPCGNAALGTKPCCQAGDVCLENSACFNADYGVTYLSGCTDDSYNDGICPSKSPWESSQWVGLIYIGDNKWSPCHQKAAPSLIESPDPCPMPTGNQIKTFPIAFSAPSRIPNVGRLPLSLGGTIKWDPDHIPPTPTGSDSGRSSTVSPFLSSSTTNSRSTITAAPSNTPTTSNPSPTMSNPSPTSTETGAGGVSGEGAGKTNGIIIGTVLGVFFLEVLVGGFLWHRRRKRQDTASSLSTRPDRVSKFEPYPSHHPHGPREPMLPMLPAEMASPDMPAMMTPTAFGELSAHPPRWSSPSELYGGQVHNSAADPSFLRSMDPAGQIQPQVGEAFPHIGSPMIGGGEFAYQGDPVGAGQPSQPTGAAPVSPSSGTYNGVGSPGSEFRVSSISDGTFGSSQQQHQIQYQDRYPGQPLPYQPYQPYASPPRGPGEENKLSSGALPAVSSGATQDQVPNSGQQAANSSPRSDVATFGGYNHNISELPTWNN